MSETVLSQHAQFFLLHVGMMPINCSHYVRTWWDWSKMTKPHSKEMDPGGAEALSVSLWHLLKHLWPQAESDLASFPQCFITSRIYSSVVVNCQYREPKQKWESVTVNKLENYQLTKMFKRMTFVTSKRKRFHKKFITSKKSEWVDLKGSRERSGSARRHLWQVR